ncbi:metallophosphoesterase [Lacrimispora sp.]|uniref:metallophosphoesterase n=1 Tax=Lacrimispora sp. TaxID=2719234 RepID=UPI002FD91872
MINRMILHISDLHLSDKDSSMLQDKNYLSVFLSTITKLKKEKEYNIDTIIISGDIYDKGGGEKTSEVFNNIVNKVKTELNINNILVVPGNHDVNRNLLIGLKGKKDIDETALWKYQKEKFEYFSLLNKSKIVNVDVEKCIVSILELSDSKVLFIGINSCYKIGENDGWGYINVEMLEKELTEILISKYDGWLKIAIFHHRPYPYKSNLGMNAYNYQSPDAYGTFDMENWNKVKPILIKNNIKTIFTGHVHGTQSSMVTDFEMEDDTMYFSTVGSIGLNFNNELLNILSNIKEDTNQENKFDIFLQKLNKKESYVSIFNNHNSFNLIEVGTAELINEHEYKYIVDEGKPRWIRWKSKKIKKEDEQLKKKNIFAEEESIPDLPENQIIEDTDYGELLLQLIRENNLYKTGHFHLNKSYMLNWIDTSYFLCNRKALNIVSKGIVEKYKKIFDDSECVIGLGVKGTILLSSIRYSLGDQKVSYYPGSGNNENKFECSIPIEKDKYETITLLIDVVHTGETVRKFIRENTKLLVEKNAKVNVICIVNTTTGGDIGRGLFLNKYKISLHELMKLRVNNCNGGGEGCPIFVKKLEQVYVLQEENNEKN